MKKYMLEINHGIKSRIGSTNFLNGDKYCGNWKYNKPHGNGN